MSKEKIRFLRWGFLLRLIVVFGGLFCATEALAVTQLTIAAIQSNVGTGITSIAIVMEDIALISGICFIFASFFKFHQHKQNPTQVPLNQGVALLVIGAGLAVFPHLLSTATQGVFGTNVGTVGATTIKSYISKS
ncbi:MAG: hypothetical protein A3F13_02320 [Gammaproteobacteria bacterium RIFCSPHIGHO2_12_FULL_40_19]|nr:MAG: hypothetical protein A3F13_02320 [Gammaproteobacteria bacterium RIFCSPHIGHO2_12_FULL_40_19]